MEVTKNRIRKMRLERGMTLKDAASYLGIKEATMQRYESGVIKNVRYEYITALSDLFSCSPAYLMGWSDQRITIAGPEPGTFVLSSMEDLHAPKKEFEGKRLMFPCPEGIKADFYFKITDDSMNGSNLKKGDTLIVDSTAEVKSGDIALVTDGGDYLVRRVYFYESGAVLRPDNTEYAPSVYADGDRRKVKIIGKAVAYFSTDI